MVVHTLYLALVVGKAEDAAYSKSIGSKLETRVFRYNIEERSRSYRVRIPNKYTREVTSVRTRNYGVVLSTS